MVWVIFLWVIAIILLLINYTIKIPKKNDFESQIILGGTVLGLVIGGLISSLLKNWFMVLCILPISIILSTLYIYVPKVINLDK
ncbi:MAG: hypothetical protein CL780_04410 [Chloroflexi bacterium]|nr:hypothetical protein [Chloroflexota bacterium]|tara:strand:+ start:4906 stop:5157 length:252 start_codon:yes stop_codon:yes gene_type:complete